MSCGTKDANSRSMVWLIPLAVMLRERIVAVVKDKEYNFVALDLQ